MTENSQITGLQHFSLIVVTVAGTGVFSLPQAVAAKAGRSAWLVVLGTGLLLTLLALLADNVASYFPDMDASSWPKALLGPWLGRAWLVLYLARSLATVFITTQIYADILGVRQYPLTPCVVHAMAITVLAALLVYSRIGALARYAQLTWLITVPILGLVALTIAQGELFHLLPLFGDKPLSDLLKGIPPAFYSSLGFDILWFSYPHLRRKQRSRLAVASAMLFIAAAYAATTVAATLGLGPGRLGTTLFPTLTMLSDLEFGVISRVDTIVLYIWIASIVVTAAAMLYISCRAANGIWGKLQLNLSVLLLGGIAFFANLYDMAPERLARLAGWVGAFDIGLLSSSLIIFSILCRLRKGRDQGAQTD